MLRRYVVVALALAAVAGGNAFLWLTRPSAQPVAPDTVFTEPQPETAPAPAAPATKPEPDPAPAESAAAKPSESAEPAQPSDPLTLRLKTGDPMPATDDVDVAGMLRKPPPLDLTLGDKPPVRPWISEDLNLFNTERGTRAFTRGHWLSDRLRLRGGIGYSEDEDTQERDIAIGVGIDLAF